MVSEAMSVDDNKSTTKRMKNRKPPGPEKLVLSRGEKDEFVGWLCTKLGDSVFRSTFLQAKQLGRARGLIRSAAVAASFSKPARGLDHAATFKDIFTRAAATATMSPVDREKLATHWTALQHAAKGSKKIIARREREDKNAHRANFRTKQKKHQCRH